jgi:hypothetical protein
VRQKYNESASEYLKRFRETRNHYYNLTIGERDLADLTFAGLASHLKGKKMEGHDFVDVNQVLQWAVGHENRAKDHKPHCQFRDVTTKEREKQVVNLVGEGTDEDDNVEVCVAERVNMQKPVSCSFLRPNTGRKEEIKYTFDVSKCDKLFDVLVQGGVIKLKEGNVIPTAEILAKRKYYKWHNSYSHITNECNYFHRLVKSALNDGQLTLGDGRKMKLDVDPFLMNTVRFEQKKILV